MTTNASCIDLRITKTKTDSIGILKEITAERKNEDPFYVIDLDDVVAKHSNWLLKLPRVHPHYAIKCNTDPLMVRILAHLGAGFDCASESEIKTVLALGVPPSRIIFANPCKQISHIKVAFNAGINYMTFDNDYELEKILAIHGKKARCVLRIVTNDSGAQCTFSDKFGADMETSMRLIDLAVKLGLDVAGISFHAGSGQMSAHVFKEAIHNARKLFDFSRNKYGCKMHLLDIGGGFPGSLNSGELFDEIAKEINTALEESFPEDFFANLHQSTDDKFRIISEPGRYYACSAFTLCTTIIAKRVNPQTKEQQEKSAENPMLTFIPNPVDLSKTIMYYINDGIFASFNSLLYDHAVVNAIILGQQPEKDEQVTFFKSSIWGPTCDGADCVIKEDFLPDLKPGQFVVFKDMGAYTSSAAVSYNGLALPTFIYYITDAGWQNIKSAFELMKDSTLIITNSPKI